MTATNWIGQKLTAERSFGGSQITVEVGERLGGGGEGSVHRDRSRSDYVLKIMHQWESRVVSKVRAMLAKAPELQTEHDQGNEIIQIAWPQEILHDSQGRFCGFSMRLLDIKKAVPLNAWFDPRSRRRNGLSQDDRIRIYLAANLASVTEYVNRAGHSVVDFKPQNVLAYREHGYVCLVDCDGFLIRSGTDIFPAAAATPSYLAPEYHQKFDVSLLDEKQDRFALAVTIYMLLDNNWHPSSGSSQNLPDDTTERLRKGAIFLDPNSGLVPPRNSHFQFFPDETLEMFHRAFVGPPEQRPTSRDWKEHLRKLTTGMIQCSSHAEHWHYGKGCPWCSSKNSTSSTPRIQLRAPVSTVQVSSVKFPVALAQSLLSMASWTLQWIGKLSVGTVVTGAFIWFVILREGDSGSSVGTAPFPIHPLETSPSISRPKEETRSISRSQLEIREALKIARFFQDRGQYNEAIKELEHARNQAPENSEIIAALKQIRRAQEAESRLNH